VGWDAYLTQARRHSEIKTTLKHARRLERERGPVDFTWGAIEPGELSQLMNWKSQQYRRSGWPDPFARRWIRETLDVLVDRRDRDLRPVFSTLRVGDELLAVDLSLLFQDVHADWFTTYDPGYAPYSPGGIRMLRMIEHACNEGIAYVDLARGDERFKRAFKNDEIDVASGLLHDRAPAQLLYRSVYTPYRATRTFVLRRPRLRSFARSSLRGLGSLRTRARGQ
jgi:CelD/BcsL family acetyltransferase involved in cellulose biosynthesis